MNTPSPRTSARFLPLALGLLLPALLLPSLSRAQATTGFNQTAAGPWNYNDTTNWVGGTINGTWDASLVTTAAQTITFGAPTTLTTGLTFGYTGNFALTLRSDGTANQTLTLGGDLTASPVSNQTITFGSTTANQGLNIDLGGNRTFTVSASKTLTFLNSITDGNITINGGGTVKLSNATGNASTSSVTVNGSVLTLDSSNTGITGTTRAANVTLAQSTLALSGGNSGTNSNDTISGTLTFSGLTGGYDIVSLSTGSKNALLSIGSLARDNQGIALFRGANLGTNTIASATGGSTNIQITGTTPTLIGGGGAAGTTTISIIPWALGGTSTSDTGSTFVTYDPINGIRPLNTSTEFASTVTDGATTTDNVRLITDATFTSTTTVNSLIIQPTANATVSGGTLKITSGAVLLNPSNTNLTLTLSSNLDFGTAQGVIGSSYNRTTNLTSKISGSGGLVLYSNSGTASKLQIGGVGGNSSDYTGDTYILSNVDTYTNNGNLFFPNGGRTGDVYLYAQLNFSGSNQIINGLNGNGVVAFGHSQTTAVFTFGDNNANGTFSGAFATTASFNSFSIVKIGSGTEQLTGDNSYYAGSTSILGGTLSVSTLTDGGLGSSIGSSANSATKLIISGGALQYTGATTSTDRLFQVGQTTTGGTATLDASGTGAVNFTNTGSLAYGTAGTTGAAQTRSLVLTGTNTGANTLSALIGNNGSATNGNSNVSVTKSGSGTWTLTNANTYTGTTTVSAGTLALGVAHGISASSNLIMSGGTFATGGFAQTLGTLTLTAASTIDLGSGTSALVFADSSASSWTSSVSLSFVNFDTGTDSIRIGTSSSGLTSQQLSQITINGLAALIDSNGYLSASAIPEPSTLALLAGSGVLLFTLGYRRKTRPARTT